MHDIPIVDKSTLLLMANNEMMMDLLEAGEFERAKSLVGWMLWSAKTYGIKAVNPGGVAAWKWGKNANQLHQPIEGYKSITAAQIIAQLAQIVDELGLPHPMHLHQNNLGVPGNVTSTIETMRVLQGHRAHLAHLQFHAYGGHDWGSMKSEAPAVAAEFLKNKNLTCDVGAILFGNAVTITADGPWQHLLYELTGRKWGNLDVENETGCGIVPYVYSDHHLVNAVQWAVGLELLLLIDDPWRVYLTTDHPNGGGFWRYPEILRLLMDVEFRKGEVRKLPAEAQKRITLGDIDRQYTFSDVAIVTSAGPARALGLTQKGHLGVGADGDVTIYSAKPNAEGVMFSYPRYVLKAGKVVVEEGQVRAFSRGPRIHRASRIRPGDRGIHPPAVPEGLHDVVRKLPDGNDTGFTTRRSCRAPRQARLRRPPARVTIGAGMITLTLKEPVEMVPLEAEVICPDTMATLKNDAVRALPVYLGKKQCRLDDFFTVEGEASDELEIRGELQESPVDRPGYEPRPHQHCRQRRHASWRLHEGRNDRSVRKRLRLGRRRDVGRIHPDCRQRRRTDRCRLSR